MWWKISFGDEEHCSRRVCVPLDRNQSIKIPNRTMISQNNGGRTASDHRQYVHCSHRKKFRYKQKREWYFFKRIPFLMGSICFVEVLNSMYFLSHFVLYFFRSWYVWIISLIDIIIFMNLTCDFVVFQEQRFICDLIMEMVSRIMLRFFFHIAYEIVWYVLETIDFF